eukprot:12480677-Alexandrium_andersonii.AAC.1
MPGVCNSERTSSPPAAGTKRHVPARRAGLRCQECPAPPSTATRPSRSTGAGRRQEETGLPGRGGGR